MEALLDLLGNPEAQYPIIHITGTNGKTSTARIAASLIGAHGLTAGTFTSPHLQRVEERLGRNGEHATPEQFAQAITDLAPFVDIHEGRHGDRPTYFELTAAAAFGWFAAEAVDVAVVEVGLGGRLDATNAADGTVAVVTGIAAEHTAYLGNTVEEIAGEKLAIAKPGSTLVTGPLPEATLPLADRTVADLSIAESRYGRDFWVEEAEPAVGGWRCSVQGAHATYEDVYLPLHGRHQTINLAVAIASVEALLGRALDEEAVREGSAAATSPGRMEVVGWSPLIMLDGAHNPDGMAALDRALAEEFPTTRWVAVLAVMGDKDRLTMLAHLQPERLQAAVVTTVGEERSVTPEELAVSATEAWGGTVPVEEVAHPVPALQRATELAGPDGAVLAAGSLYLLGELRTELGLG